MNEYMKQRWEKRRLKAITYLGGSCVRCGTVEELNFHHKDPTTKAASIGRASSWSEVRFWEEIDKCELLCEDCHRDHHKSAHPHGTTKRYWRGCRCDQCKQANTIYNQQVRKQHSKPV